MSAPRPVVQILAIGWILLSLALDRLVNLGGGEVLLLLPAVWITLWSNEQRAWSYWLIAAVGTMASLAGITAADLQSPVAFGTRMLGLIVLWGTTLMALARVKTQLELRQTQGMAEFLETDNTSLRKRAEASRSELAAMVRASSSVQWEVEQALRDSEALYHSLVDHLPLSVLRKDTNFVYTFVSRRYLEFSGKRADEILGKTDFDLFPQDLAHKYRVGDEQVLKTGKLFDDIEQYRKPDGELRYIQVLKMPVHDSQQRIIGTQVMFWDVTDKHKAEEAMERFACELEQRNRALRESEENLRRQTEILESVLRSIADGVVVADDSYRFLIWNPAATKIVGIGPTEGPADTWQKVYGLFEVDGQTPIQPEHLPLSRAIRGEEVHDMELLIRNPGKPQGAIVSVNGTPLRDQEGAVRGGVVVFRDITERRRAEAEIHSKNQDLETLLYVTSHDLREPLRAIENFSKLVHDRYSEQLDDKGRDFLKRVIGGAHRLDRLLEDVLTLSRVERTTHPVDDVPLADVLADVLRQLEHRIRETGARVEAVSSLPVVRADRRWATQAVQNLVSNALKYTQDGVSPDIEVAEFSGPEGIGLVVRDRGIGVPEELAERIFGLFQRAVNRNIEGTGAGLAIVKRVAERHGGRAWVQPRPGGGSEFFVTFGPGRAA